MERQPTGARASRAVLLATGLVLLAAAAGLGAWIYVRGNHPFAIDQWWNAVLAGWWLPVIGGFSRVMNALGGGWAGVLAIPVVCALGLVLLRRPWAAVCFLSASAVSAALVQVLKHTFGRARPEEMLILSDFGSYPSGHVANAATIATAAALVFPRLAVLIAGAVWVTSMAFTRTYLHAHWLSDTLGGALAGVGAALVVGALFAGPMARESDAATRRLARRTPGRRRSR